MPWDKQMQLEYFMCTHVKCLIVERIDNFKAHNCIMLQARSFSTFIFIITLVCSGSIANAQQDCSCPQFDKEYQDTYDRLFAAHKMDSARLHAKKLLAAKGCCAALGNILLANTYLLEKQFDSVPQYVDKADKLMGKQYDSLASPEILRIRGMLAAAESDPEGAAEFYMAGLEQSKKYHNDGYVVKFCNELSHTYASINKPEPSLKFLKEGAVVAERLKDDLLCAMIYANMLATYGMFHENTKIPAYLDTMEILAPISIDYAKKAKNPFYIVRGYTSLGGIAIEKGDYKTALAYNDTVMTMLPPVGAEQLLISAQYRRGQCLLQLGRVDEAISSLHAALANAKAFKSPGIISLMNQQLYYTYRDLGKPDSALFYFERHVAVRDSLSNVENTTALTELEQKYDKVQNEKKISELSKEKQINTLQIRILAAGILVTLLVSLSIFLYYRQKSLNNKKLILETEQRLNRARMNPHFFFNALASLQGFALRENDGKALANNLSKFSHIMRETLESTYKDYVTIQQEMDFLHEYLTLQQIRFPQAFKFAMSADALGDPDEWMIPSMIIQPFVENSIEHGFRGIDHVGEITILFDEDGDNIVVSILDNGKGLGGEKEVNNEHISRASQIIRDRIYLLNLKLKTNASFQIANQEGGNGVQVVIRLPKIDKNESAHN